jgi:hypothetical protein
MDFTTAALAFTLPVVTINPGCVTRGPCRLQLILKTITMLAPADSGSALLWLVV